MYFRRGKNPFLVSFQHINVTLFLYSMNHKYYMVLNKGEGMLFTATYHMCY